MPKAEDSRCPGLGDEPCSNKHMPGSAWCREHHREYHRQYKRGYRRRLKNRAAAAEKLAQLVLDRKYKEAEAVALEVLDQLPREVSRPAAGLQSVLDKHASPE